MAYHQWSKWLRRILLLDPGFLLMLYICTDLHRWLVMYLLSVHRLFPQISANHLYTWDAMKQVISVADDCEIYNDLNILQKMDDTQKESNLRGRISDIADTGMGKPLKIAISV